MRILIVDDDYVSRTKLKVILSGHGDCDAVANGQLAVAMFQAAHEEKVPYDLITMDIAMPGMSGQDAVREIRSAESSLAVGGEEKVKILMITAKKDMKNVAESYYEGCEGYVTKPITPESIAGSLKEIGLA